jgi:hypothetical protein
MAFSAAGLKPFSSSRIVFSPASGERIMWRKLLVACGFAAMVGTGFAASSAPAQAQVGFGIQIGGPDYYYGPARHHYGPPRYYGPPRHYYGPPRYRYRDGYRHRRHRDCERVVRRVWDGYGWRRVVERRCYR